MTRKIPHSYLGALTLRDVLALASAVPPEGEPAAVEAITAALEQLAAELAERDASQDADDREWLAAQMEALHVGDDG